MKPQNTAERRTKVKEVLNAALDLNTGERAAYVAEVCADEAEVRAEVESMLAVKTEAEAVFEDSKRGFLSEKTFEAVENAFVGKIIGNYRLLREIGAGGMGVVFLAEHTGGEFEQQVAVKILRHGRRR